MWGINPKTRCKPNKSNVVIDETDELVIYKKCDNCKGSGWVPKFVSSDNSTTCAYETTEVCPTCDGLGEVPTGEYLHVQNSQKIKLNLLK